jgi:hypothetical protein
MGVVLFFSLPRPPVVLGLRGNLSKLMVGIVGRLF